MDIKSSVLDLIGNTPLLKLRKASEETGCLILGKAEFLNPCGSVKDRAALQIIHEAEENGSLKKGGAIIEGTAGNTGIGLAVVANALGYKCIIVMPNTQSQEKKDALTSLGVELIQVDPCPFSNPAHFVHQSRAIAEKMNKAQQGSAIWANQFDNIANRRAHELTTVPEIWKQTDGKIDAFTCSAGTGGTFAGISRGLKKLNSDVRLVLADPMGASLYNYYKHGELKSEGGSIVEGIGQGRITKNLEDIVVDDAYQVTDTEAMNALYDLIRHEGLCLGGSSGINVAAALKLAHDMGPNHVIVTILPDGGSRYMSKLYNPEFLKSKDLPLADWMI
jgi:cysteine synthase A